MIKRDGVSTEETLLATNGDLSKESARRVLIIDESQPVGSWGLRGRIVDHLKSSPDWSENTWIIGRRLKVKTALVRAELKRLEVDGIVRRIERWSSCNNIRWQIIKKEEP